MKRIISLCLIWVLVFMVVMQSFMPGISAYASSLPVWLSPEYRNTNTTAGGEVNALYNTLMDFFKGKSTQFIQSLNEQERIAFGEELKQAYIDGFKKDAYSRNLPFNSDYVTKVLALCPVRFFDWYGAQVQQYSAQLSPDSEDSIMTHVDMQLGILSFDSGDMASNFMHETGHLLGLGEGLTMLLETEYRGLTADFPCDTPGDWRYDQCFFDLLVQRTGKEKFWEIAFTSQTAFEMLWNEHMNFIPFQTFFETMKLNLVALTVYAYGDKEFANILLDFEQHADLTRSLLDEFGYIHEIYMRIEQGDNTQRSYANAFFAKVTSFDYSVWYDWEALNVVLTPTIDYLNTNVPTINNIQNLDSASSWAHDGIRSAIMKGFVPADLQHSFQSVITRAEFCRMAVKWLEYRLGKNIDDILAEKGLSRDPNTFSDTQDQKIFAAYALGITSGTTAPTASKAGVFTPNGNFSREQAATMIRNTCKAAGMDVSTITPAGFEDISNASIWAVDGVNFCYANGIMVGTRTSPLQFSPKTTYTREQSIVTFNNIR